MLGVLVTALVSACGSPTAPTPPPPPVQNIEFVPPPDVTVANVPAPSAPVSYPLPIANGGAPPVTVTCTPPSGSMFPIGATVVNCTATDGVRTAAAHFTVTVTQATPVLRGTRFLAFGDSLTTGENGIDHLLFIDTGFDYPTLLTQLLVQRYTTQSPSVTDDGKGGEHALGRNLDPNAADVGGTDRIGGEIDSKAPDALLLMEGVNDLSDSNAQPLPVLQDRVVTALRFDVETAKNKGVKGIFLSTLTPVKPGLRDWAIHYSDLITPINAAIRTLAAQEGVVLVDCYQALSGNLALYIEDDGLHWTRDGSMAVANAFLAGIEANFEVTAQPAGVRRIASPLSNRSVRPSSVPAR